MATKKQRTGRTLSKKVRQIIKGDVIKSIAVTSVLLNVLFLITVVVLSNRTTFDRRVYTAARNRYCNNQSALDQRAAELNDRDAAVKERQIDCVGSNFMPFYKEAIEKFSAQPRQ